MQHPLFASVVDKDGNKVGQRPIFHKPIYKVEDTDYLRIVSVGKIQAPTQVFYRINNGNWIPFNSLGHINEIIPVDSDSRDIDFKYQDHIIYGKRIGLYPLKGIWLIHLYYEKN